MPRLGDTVSVQVRGGSEGAHLSAGQASIGIGAGASMVVPGKIFQDLGDRRLVQLSISLGGANRIEIQKKIE